MSIEKILFELKKETFKEAVTIFKNASDSASEEKDIVKQKYAATAFDVSVNTLKEWVQLGCPEIRLNSGMVLYSKKAIREWLLQFQKQKIL